MQNMLSMWNILVFSKKSLQWWGSNKVIKYGCVKSSCLFPQMSESRSNFKTITLSEMSYTKSKYTIVQTCYNVSSIFFTIGLMRISMRPFQTEEHRLSLTHAVSYCKGQIPDHLSY